MNNPSIVRPTINESLAHNIGRPVVGEGTSHQIEPSVSNDCGCVGEECSHMHHSTSCVRTVYKGNERFEFNEMIFVSEDISEEVWVVGEAGSIDEMLEDKEVIGFEFRNGLSYPIKMSSVQSNDLKKI